MEQLDHVNVAPSHFTEVDVVRLNANLLGQCQPAQSRLQPELRQLCGEGGFSCRPGQLHVVRRCRSRVPSRRFSKEAISSRTAASTLSTSAGVPLLQNDSVSKVKG